MRVRCVSTKPNNWQIKDLEGYYFEGKQEFGLTIGQEFLVFGLSILGKMPYIDIAYPGESYLSSV